jgi:phenylpropionate dioxygenase-like ring-hydroxylating dioxygenase large terminal subunit
MSDGFDLEAEEALFRRSRAMWHPVAFADDVDDAPVAVRLLDESLVIVRLNGEVTAFRDLCIHRGTALSAGKVAGENLQCAYHGWEFDSTGRCVRIPSRPQGSIPTKARVEKHACQEAAGLVWVCLEPPALFPLPTYAAGSDPTYRTVRIPLYDWNSSAARRVENFVDFSHFPFVHAGILGDPDRPEIPDHPVVRTSDAITFELGVEEVPNALKGDAETGAPIQREPSIYTISMPYTVSLDQPLEDGHHFQLFMASSPIGRKRTRTFSWCSRNYDLDPHKDADFVEFQRVILEQDRVVVESQRPEALPIDLSEELHIKGVDQVSIDYRRWLLELATG